MWRSILTCKRSSGGSTVRNCSTSHSMHSCFHRTENQKVLQESGGCSTTVLFVAQTRWTEASFHGSLDTSCVLKLNFWEWCDNSCHNIVEAGARCLSKSSLLMYIFILSRHIWRCHKSVFALFEKEKWSKPFCLMIQFLFLKFGL